MIEVPHYGSAAVVLLAEIMITNPLTCQCRLTPAHRPRVQYTFSSSSTSYLQSSIEVHHLHPSFPFDKVLI